MMIVFTSLSNHIIDWPFIPSFMENFSFLAFLEFKKVNGGIFKNNSWNICVERIKDAYSQICIKHCIDQFIIIQWQTHYCVHTHAMLNCWGQDMLSVHSF